MARIFTQTFGVVGAIIERGGKFLLVRENNESHPDHGKWNQPAGWIDVGESPIEAVKREVREETGYNFLPTHVLGVYSLVRKNHPGPENTSHALKIIFDGAISGKQNELSVDISETRWFPPEEIYAMDGQTLRDADIKDEVRDYLAGTRYPLNIIHHTIVKGDR